MKEWCRRQSMFRKLYYDVITSVPINSFPPYRWLLDRRIAQADRVGDCPAGMSIEVTTICNAKCHFCPNKDLAPSTMKLDIFEKIVREAKVAGVRHLTLTGVGETLLDKKFFDRLEILREVKFDMVSFFTNGTYVTGKNVEKLLGSPVTNMIFSIDSVDPEKYYQMRKLDFNVVDQNLKSFSKVARGKIHLSVAAIHLADHPFKEIQDVYDRYFKEDIVDMVTFVKEHNWATGKPAYLSDLPCDYLWHNMFIRTDGKMVICCLDWSSQEVLGDLNTESLQSILTGRLRELKDLHLAGKRSEVPVCRTCTHIPDWWVTRHKKVRGAPSAKAEEPRPSVSAPFSGQPSDTGHKD